MAGLPIGSCFCDCLLPRAGTKPVLGGGGLLSLYTWNRLGPGQGKRETGHRSAQLVILIESLGFFGQT